ncbi:MAG TPA: hypothetical protein PLB89_05260 [Flavobacteriales bacterium]|nr:hypothetical protein [Flavobacteriales bacterium]
MRTALITVGDKQQVLLQPENLREHRVLQMLKMGGADISVQDAEYGISAQGSLQQAEQPTSYCEATREKLKPVLIQVQPGMAQIPDPDVVVFTKAELNEAMAAMCLQNKGLDADRPRDLNTADIEGKTCAVWIIEQVNQWRTERGTKTPRQFK